MKPFHWVLIALAAGCYTPRYSVDTLPAEQLAGLRTGRQREEIIGRDAAGAAVRIGPTSILRFERRDGSFSAEVHARDLTVSADGVHGQLRRIPLAEARGARVSGLAAPYADLLDAAAPEELATARDGDVRVLPVGGAKLISWIQELVRRAAASQPASVPGDHWAAAALGRWSFDLPQAGGWSPAVDASTMIDALSTGLPLRDGLRWSDIRSVQVANVSGGKSFGVTIGVTIGNAVVGVFILAAAALGAATSLRWAERGPSFGTAVDRAARGGQVASGLVSASADRPRPSSTAHQLTLWGAGLTPPPDGPRARPFSCRRMIRSVVEPRLALDSGADPWRPGVIGTSLAATLRLGEVYELGGGVRHLWLRETELRAAEQSFGGFFRFGMVFDTGAQRRFEIPLSFDLGSGQGVDFQGRASLGLRVAVSRHLYLGILPFQPTYTSFAKGAGQGEPAWTFPSSLELEWRP